MNPVGRNEFDDRAQGRFRNLYLRSIDLSTARTDVEFIHSGNLVYFDKLTDGSATIKFNSADNDPFPVGANSKIQFLPFKKLYITNAAQSGKTLNLWYGQDVSIQPPNQDITSIGRVDAVTIVDKVSPHEIGDSVYYSSDTSTSLITIVTPSTNVNGVVISNASLFSVSGDGSARLMVKTSAPVSWDDSNALSVSAIRLSGGNFAGADNAVMPVAIPAGYGVYFQKDSAFTHLADITYKVL